MAAVSLTVDDLTPFVPGLDENMAALMIADVLAKAARVAPCITEDSFTFDAAAKATLRGVLLRWIEQGNGALASRSVTKGPFSESETYDTRQQRRGAFWPSEIADLQELCKVTDEVNMGAFTIDTAPCGTGHSPICALAFGASYCSCGADIAGFALYEDVEP